MNCWESDRNEILVSGRVDGGDTVWRVVVGKKRYLDLLLLADEQESMIDRYLERGDMFVLRRDGRVVAECVVTREAEDVCEVKNIATVPLWQRTGCGRKLLAFVEEFYRDVCRVIFVGTGDSPVTLGFYENCGFRYSHRIANFFTDHYDSPIFEEGRQLVDMIYLKKEL